MKTNLITFATLFFVSVVFPMTGFSNEILTMDDSSDNNLTVTVKPEKATYSLPFDTAAIFNQSRINDVNKTIDLSTIIKPEAEVDDIQINLKEVFSQIDSQR